MPVLCLLAGALLGQMRTDAGAAAAEPQEATQTAALAACRLAFAGGAQCPSYGLTALSACIQYAD